MPDTGIDGIMFGVMGLITRSPRSTVPVNLRRSYCYSRYEGAAPDGKRLLGESIVKATCEGFVAISCEFATVIDAQYAIKVMKEQGWYPDGWVKVAYPTPTTIDLWVVQPEDGVATRALVTNPSEYMICNGLSWRKCGSCHRTQRCRCWSTLWSKEPRSASRCSIG